MNKKGQLALFIILAIIIVGAGILYYYGSRKPQTPADNTPTVTQLNEYQRSLKDYVDSCLQQIVLDGVEILRIQGGYIYLENISTLQVPSRGSVIEMENGVPVIRVGTGTNLVGYWLTNDKVSFPSVNYMEFQLQRYIEQRMPLCVQDFTAFKKQGWIVDAKNPKAYVMIRQTVETGIIYPITFVKNGEWKLDTFEYSVPIKLATIQNLAEEITVHEYYTHYLERQTKRWIGYYQGVDEKLLPPFQATISSTECETVNWQKPDVKEKVSSIITTYTPEIRLAGTTFMQRHSTDAVEQAVINQFTEKFLLYDYGSMSVQHTFNPSVAWDFDIYPRSGETIKPDKYTGKGIPFLPQICNIKYAYKYFLSYPVIVEISDPESAQIDIQAHRFISHGGYTFDLPLQVFICGNQERECVAKPQYFVDVENAVKNLTSLGFLADQGYCRNSPARLILTAHAMDIDDNSPVPHVEFQYQCGNNQPICSLGTTDPSGNVQSGVPSCVNGRLSLLRDGYSIEMYTLSSTENEEQTITYPLHKEYLINVSVSTVPIKEYIRQTHEFGFADVETLKQVNTDRVLVNIPKIKESFFTYPLQKEIHAVTGTHQVTTQILGGKSMFSLGVNTTAGFATSNALTVNWTIHIEDLKRYHKAELYSWKPDNSTDWQRQDQFIEPNGDIAAILVFQKDVQGYQGTEPVCGSTQRLISISGYNRGDVNSSLSPCQVAETYRIPSDDYQKTLQPRFVS
jgi:hypothetical protein